MGEQFSPGMTKIYTHSKSEDATTNEQTWVNGESKTTLATDQVQKRLKDSYSKVKEFNAEVWDFERQ